MSRPRPHRDPCPVDDPVFDYLFARYRETWHGVIAAIEAHEALRLGLVDPECLPA